LYVTLGLTTLAGLAIAQSSSWAASLAAAAAIFSFLGAACWLFEAQRAGRAWLWLVALAAIATALLSHAESSPPQDFAWMHWIAIVNSGLVLGLTFAAMLLGHWYLNAPGMELAPLRRLLAAAALAVGAQAMISAAGLAATLAAGGDIAVDQLPFIVLRWSFGICGVLALLWMTWRTLEIPNTQSATGILYVAVIGVFVGELAAALLSTESVAPL
jgi:hypothetical protein